MHACTLPHVHLPSLAFANPFFLLAIVLCKTPTDERPAVADYKVTKSAEMLESTNLVLKHLGIDPTKQGMKITLGGDLCCASGIGASAANCVSLARALSVAFDLGLTEEQVNEAAYEGEKGYHGTPSGIDNTASTYGGVLKFQRTEGAPIFETKRLASECRIVYATTGITASTTKVVGDIADRRAKEPEWYARACVCVLI
jgi:mevalonate kinase